MAGKGKKIKVTKSEEFLLYINIRYNVGTKNRTKAFLNLIKRGKAPFLLKKGG